MRGSNLSQGGKRGGVDPLCFLKKKAHPKKGGGGNYKEEEGSYKMGRERTAKTSPKHRKEKEGSNYTEEI